MKYFLSLCLVFLSLIASQQTFAGLVPGTISKGAYSDNAYCASSSTTYSPTTGSVYCSAFATCEAASCNPTGDTHNLCQDVSCGCGSYTANPVGSFSLTDYSNFSKQPVFGSSAYSRKLVIDQSRYCTANAYKTASVVEPGYSTWTCPAGNCAPVSFQIRSGWSDAACGLFSSTDNLITSFDQLGGMTNSSPTDGDNSCTVEGRYASIDDNGPSVSIINWGVFTTNLDKWCSLAKWQLGKGANLGCEYLKTLGSHPTSTWTGPVDLLEGLAINIGSDQSGIGSVFIELGKCTATYDFPKDSSILNSTINANGVKSANTQGFTIPYNTSFTFAGASYPSLRTALGANGTFGLNECLDEGKNYLRITAKDNARSNNDGVTLVSNATVFVSGNGSANYPDGGGLPSSTVGTATINIDEAAPSVALNGDAKNYFDSNASSNCFIGSANKDQHWKNYTISGAIKTGDPFGPNCAPTVNNISPTTLTCNISDVAGIGGSGPSAPIYTAPVGVNPTTGKFTAYTYDGFGPVPTTASCDWGCKDGYTKNTKTKTCDSAAIHTCPTGQVWDGTQCKGLPVCTAGGVVPCIVAPPEVVSPPASYSWVTGNFGSCSATCGGGTQTRSVVCQNNQGTSVPDSYCDINTKPEANHSCAQQDCGGSWSATNGICGSVPGTCAAGVVASDNNQNSCGQTRAWVCNGKDGWSNTSCSFNNPVCPPAVACPALGPKVSWDGTDWEQGQSNPCWSYSSSCKWTDGNTCNFGHSNWSLQLKCSAGSWIATGNSCGGSTSTYTYSWQTGNYGSCSATCGGGTQTRSVVCVMDQGGSVVADSYCAGPKPTDSISCNTQVCAGDCIVSVNGIAKATLSIGGTYAIQNWQQLNPGDSDCESMSAAVCYENVYQGGTISLSGKTMSWSCGAAAVYTYSWDTGTYGTCSATCGGGTQSRLVVCKRNDGLVVADNNCTGPKPTINQSCNTQSCWWGGSCDITVLDTSWIGDVAVWDPGWLEIGQVGEYPNGNGMRTSCAPYWDAKCLGTIVNSYTIRYRCSAYSWVVGNYGTCSATCGGGTQIRSVTCQRDDGVVVDNWWCTGPKPTETLSCNTDACSGPISTGEYQLFDGYAVIDGVRIDNNGHGGGRSCTIYGYTDSLGCGEFANTAYTKESGAVSTITGNARWECRDYVPSIWLHTYEDGTCDVIFSE